MSRYLLLSVLAPLASLPLSAQTVVSPADRAELEGSSFTHFPLGRASTRMQTLHRDLPGGTLLLGHAYRRDAVQVTGAVDPMAIDLQVTVSMSPNAPNQASSTFANNVGPSPVVVLPRTVLTLPGTARPSLDPAPGFELTIPYSVPFQVPAQGGTVCIDVEIFGNVTSAGTDKNVSVYLDAHQQYSDGRCEQPAFRTFLGCPAPGSTTNSYGTMSLWRLTGSSQLDLSIRYGVADTGNGLTRAFVLLGTGLDGSPWPLQPNCPFWSSAEVWYAMPGTMDASGSYDGTLTGLSLLPPGYRLWCQAGSIDLGTAAMAFTDALTLVTPPTGLVPVAAARIANSTDHSAATGTVSLAVPVMSFF